MSTFMERLGILAGIFIFGFLFFWFPGGVITMGIACHDSAKLDAWDWIFSIFVPFYGLIESFVC